MSVSGTPGATTLTSGDSSLEATSMMMTTTMTVTQSSPTGIQSGSPSDNQGGGGNQFASSTASNLYLYTFLATLVLLLFVSGAVIVRSIMIRVRARRTIEESIRNGTYVPPPPRPGATNAPKPVFHDAHLKETAFVDEKNGKWDAFVPVAASFIPSGSQRTLPHPATSAPPSRTNGSLTNRLRVLNPFRAVYLQDILDELASRDLHARMMLQQTAQPTQPDLAAAAFGTPPPAGDGSAEQREIERPSGVRVAVLIAMPDPAHPTSVNLQNETHSLSSASSSSSFDKGKTPAAGTEVPKNDEEPELPYVEFGYAVVPLTARPQHTSSSPAHSPPAQPSSFN